MQPENAHSTIQQKERIVSYFSFFTFEELSCLADAIRTGNYSFEVAAASDQLQPIGALGFLFENRYYQDTYKDEDSYWRYLLICFKDDTGCLLKTPVSIYGVSPKWKLRSCLITLETLSQLIKANEDDLKHLIGEEEPALFARYWDVFTRGKAQLMRSLFEFYLYLGDGYGSAMDWKIRPKNSLTREVVEAIAGTARVEDQELDQEFYINDWVDQDTIQFLKECTARKKAVYESNNAGVISKIPFTSYPPEAMVIMKHFYSGLVKPRGEQHIQA